MPTFAGSQRKLGNSRKTSTAVSSTTPKPFDCVDHNKLWKIPKEMGLPDHLTCLLRDTYAGPDATIRTGHGKNRLVLNQERHTSRLYFVICLSEVTDISRGNLDSSLCFIQP